MTPDQTIRRARVMLSEPVGLLDYLLPDPLVAQVTPGTPIRVPLGRRLTTAYVASIEEGPGPPGIKLRPIEDIDIERPHLPAALVELILFAADYYGAPPGAVLAAALPGIGRRDGDYFRITPSGRDAGQAETTSPPERAILEVAARQVRGFRPTTVEQALGWSRGRVLRHLKRQVERGWLERNRPRRGPRRIVAYKRVDRSADGLTRRQAGARALLERIPPGKTIPAADLAKTDRQAYPRLRSLERFGLVERVYLEQRCRPSNHRELVHDPPTPTTEQQTAIETISGFVERGEYQTVLLQGVTGSGKTEVYLRVIEYALARDRTALVLVPEIALTPQLGARFRARFGKRVATFHSGLTTAERRDEWERIATGEATIGLGARSAVFLPFRNLGVVIVDEEYETSFKQEDTPRYNARDLAVVRGHKENAVVVLGSATPALETKANATNGRYELLLMPTRVHTRPLPIVERVDLTSAARVGAGVFTAHLATSVEKTLRRDQQVVLFLNRRGFAPHVFCRDCGHSFRCPDCDVAMTFHQLSRCLLCHYCGHEDLAPDICPMCLSHRVETHGLGTERVEEEIGTLFGSVPVGRLDRDTVRRRSDLERVLDQFASGTTKVLIGTQMVAKGHDFPGVTLVGVVSADASLNFPDFRAAERTFQLLTQVAGRAGRGTEEGRVVVQSYEVNHYAICAAAEHDYEAFFQQEIQHRRELDYPPFSRLALLRWEGADPEKTLRLANDQAARLRSASQGLTPPVKVLGPAPAPLTRLRGAWRFQLLLKATSRTQLRAVLANVPSRPAGKVRQILDVDPFNML